MPIFEFKCLKCDHLFELIVKNQDETVDLTCPQCRSDQFERVISQTNFMMGQGSGRNNGSDVAQSQTRQCSGGSCTTYDIPGYARS